MKKISVLHNFIYFGGINQKTEKIVVLESKWEKSFQTAGSFCF